MLRGDGVWIYPTERGEDTDTSSLVTSKEEEGDSDNSHVLVNAMGLEEKHVNFVDVQRGEEGQGEEGGRWMGEGGEEDRRCGWSGEISG